MPIHTSKRKSDRTDIVVEDLSGIRALKSMYQYPQLQRLFKRNGKTNQIQISINAGNSKEESKNIKQVNDMIMECYYMRNNIDTGKEHWWLSR